MLSKIWKIMLFRAWWPCLMVLKNCLLCWRMTDTPEYRRLSLLPAVRQWKVRERERVETWELSRWQGYPMTNQTCDSSADIFGVPCWSILACSSLCVFICLPDTLVYFCQLCLCLPHLLLQYAVEDEDKHALQRVEDGEEVGHDHGALVDVHEAESPGQAQQAQQSDGPNHPRPTKEGQEKSSRTIFIYVLKS